MTSIKTWPSLIIFGVVLVLWLAQTGTIHESWNESTRLAAIESLVERGTWRIDASPYGHETGDKLLLDGHYYSDKPPLFAAIGAVFYVLLHYGLGANLAIDGCQPGTVCVYYWLTVLMVGLPSALMAALFYRLAVRQIGSAGWAAGITGLLCLGTVVWPYSIVLNHHLPAAIALFGGFYLLFNARPGPMRLFLAGLLAGLAMMLDLTSVFVAMALFLVTVIYYRRNWFYFVAGGLIPGVFTLIFNYQITGGLLPPYFSGQGYNYPGSPFDVTVGGQHPPANVWLYSFRSLVGDRGLFFYSPLLVFAIAGLWQVLKGCGAKTFGLEGQLFPSGLMLLGIVGQFVFVLTRTNNFGADAYGERFFIPVIPVLFAFIIFIVPAQFYKPGGKWLAALGGLVALASVFSAWQGAQGTWHQIEPPIFWATTSNFPYVALKTNLTWPHYQPTLSQTTRPVRHFEKPVIGSPLQVNFNNELLLLGYNLSARRVNPGQNLDITLYWQSLRVVEADYFVFTHLLDAQQTRQGGLDRRLQEGYPVKFWYPGEIVPDDRHIPVNADATNGLVWLRVGMYQPTLNGYKTLPLITGDSTSDVTLGPILIGHPPGLVMPEQLRPQTPLNVELGQPPVIRLRGYDLTQAGMEARLTLYWQSLAHTPVDWTLFVHLRNEAGQIVAQKDGPAGNGKYSTSLWNTGEIIADQVVVPLEAPPNADYRLLIGLYDLATGTRLPVEGYPANEILLNGHILIEER